MKRGMSIDPLCPLCQSKTEDVDHLFLNYTVTQCMWGLASAYNWIDTTCLADSQRRILQLLSHIRATLNVSKIYRVVALLWSIRRTMNNKMFRDETLIPGTTLICATKS